MNDGSNGGGGLSTRSRWRAAEIRSVVAIVAVSMCVGVGGLALGLSAYSRHYAGRIYPGASVYGVDLGGLNADQNPWADRNPWADDGPSWELWW